MKDSEKEFARIIRENKTTIYTVCYMFSKDKDEVEELFQEALPLHSYRVGLVRMVGI
jgi:RNA polymerase sigma-70 factor (ECF subfamily)